MKNKYFNVIPGFFLMIAFLLSACSEDEPLPPFNVNFANQEIGIAESSTIEVIFSRTAENDGELTLQLNSGNLVYGEDGDFYTIPAVSSQQLVLPFMAGDNKVSFELKTGTNLNIQQDEVITFTLLEDAGGLYVPGQNTTFDALFGENFIAREGTIEFNGGGEEQPNQVFVDLSKLEQIVIDKKSWDLGFYNGDDKHRVILNSSAYVMARPLDKTDIGTVTASDTLGFAAAMQIPQFVPAFGAIEWVDSSDGDLDKTAFGEITADFNSANVYIVKRDGNWKKVKISQEGSDYRIQYADIGSDIIFENTVSKDNDFNFNFLSLENGEVAVEPAKDNWDIMYGTYTVGFPFQGTFIPYGFNDYIILNRSGVAAAMVMEADISYDDFAASDTESLNFNTAINTIGSSWRSLGSGPGGSSPQLRDDRFYIIKDAEQNIYKLKFTRLTSSGGERGYPEFTYALVE